MRRNRKVKIIATLGPASSRTEQIRNLFLAGVDTFRLNFSHGTSEDHRRRFEIIRSIEQETGRPIGILADLQGPKLRIGHFTTGSVTLVPGAAFRLDLLPDPGDVRRVSLPHPELFTALQKDDWLLLDDGKIRLRITKTGSDFADTEVIFGGSLSNNKGVNLPGRLLDISPLTEKDRRDLDFALEIGVDWIALSFVQRVKDIEEARQLIGGRAALMVKIEKPTALDELEEMIEVVDAMMVARGDLGVEMPPESVPPLQKRIIRACRLAGKPVIVATQMLDSMVHTPTPTRAEASDVATAVYDGADCVMLSAESASGDYPVEAVTMMNRIIENVEADPHHRRIMNAEPLAPEHTSSDAITKAAAQVAQTINAALIVTYTTSGSTCLRCARERPIVPIMGLTPRLNTARILTLVWGVHTIPTEEVGSTSTMVSIACQLARQDQFAEIGQSLVITAGVPFGTPGATNLLRIAVT